MDKSIVSPFLTHGVYDTSTESASRYFRMIDATYYSTVCLLQDTKIESVSKRWCV